MSGGGRKRAGNGCSSNSSSSMQQNRHVRQGSSFSTCPACGTSVHAALMSFHISSCPVVAGDAVALSKTKTESKPLLGHERTKARRDALGTEQSPVGSPEFSLQRKRGIPQKPAWEEDEEYVTLEEEQPIGRVSLSTEAGEKPLCPLPETPIQEGRDWSPVRMAMTSSPSPLDGLKRDPADARRERLFEDWGQRLSPEPELAVELSPSHVATAPSSPVDDSQAKRPKVMEPDDDEESRNLVHLGLMDSKGEGEDVADVESLPFLGSILDSQQERHEEVKEEDVAAQRASNDTEEIPQEELGEELESQQKLQGDEKCPLDTTGEIQNGKKIGADVCQREVQLESDIKELAEKCNEWQRALQVKNEECEELRRREQGLRKELVSVRGRVFELETNLQELREVLSTEVLKTTVNHVTHMLNQSNSTQICKEEEFLATQLLSQTSNPPASWSGSPMAVKDEFDVKKVGSEDLLEMNSNEEQATQLLSDGLDSGSAACVPENGTNSQASAEFRKVCGSGTAPPEGMHRESSLSPKTTLSKVVKFPARRLFDDGTETPIGSPRHELETPLQSSKSAEAAVLAPQTPGKALKPAADEHDKSEGVERIDNANVHTVGNQRTEGTPGGGPKTPKQFAVMLGGQEKGLISEMLDSFPPAQGMETQNGIDPFDDHFLHTVDEPAPNVPSVSMDPTDHPLQDVGTVSGADQKSSHGNERPALFQTSQDSQEETLAGLWPKDKRLKNPVLLSDSGDNGRPAVLPPSEDSQEETLAEILPKTKRPKNAAALSDSEDSERPAVPQPSEDSQEETLAEMGPKKKRLKTAASVSDSHDIKRTAVPRPSEGSQEETLADMTPKKKRRMNPVLLIDSDSDDDSGGDDMVHDVKPSPTCVGDSRKRTPDGMLSGTESDKFNPAADSHPVPTMETPSRDISFDQRRPSSPTIDFLFRMEGEVENAPGISGGGNRKTSTSVGSTDPIIEALRRSQHGKVISPRRNENLSSTDNEDDMCGGSRGSTGKAGKRRRLFRVKDSLDGADSLQPDPVLEGTKETSTKGVRRSERLRNVHVGPKRSTVPSEEEEESDPIEDRRSEDLATGGHGSSVNPLVLDDNEEDPIEIDSDSSDGGQIRARPKQGNFKTSQSRNSSAVQRDLFGEKLDVDIEDDIDTDDSFINDEPESDVDAVSSSSVDEISDSGDERENEGSSGSRSSSDKCKKYNWELEGDMLAELAKDRDLCLRGLCALFRRQEEDEKIWSTSKHRNRIGLSAFHAVRASNYAIYLMEGFMSGPVLKTADELKEEFDEGAVTYCSDMCIHYSKQLFDIYENHEDPYFPEPYVDPLM